MNKSQRLTQWTIIFGLLLVIVIAGCEPLAPPEQQGDVVVITATSTITPEPSLTPPLSTALPTRQVIFTPTPTAAVVSVPTVEPCDEPEGRLIDSTFTSAIVGTEIEYRLYVPPCFFDTLRRYPYLVLMHGSGYDYKQWTEDLSIQNILDERIFSAVNALPPMVIVMPDGNTLQDVNQFEIGTSWEDVILTELMPAIERQYCVYTTANGKAIGGISRGGFWAMSIAFRHPNTFSAVGGHSPWFVDNNAPATHNPLDLANAINADVPLRIYLDHGGQDDGGPNVLRLSSILRRNNVIHTYETDATGEHSNDYWSQNVERYLDFYGQNWAPNPAAFPSCFE